MDALVERDQGGQRYYVQQDANYNVTAITDALGNVRERYALDLYGGSAVVLTASWGQIPASLYSWVYLHQGGRYDSETGLYDFRNRFYDPDKGRWLNLDPIGFSAGDSNLYRYEGDGPTTATDPSGLEERHTADYWKKKVNDRWGLHKGSTEEKNRARTSAYEQLFLATKVVKDKIIRNDQLYPWLGFAAIVSRKVGHGLVQSLGVRDKVYELLKAGNEAIFDDVYWVFYAYDEAETANPGEGIKLLQKLNENEKQVPDDMLKAFTLIHEGKNERDSNKIWKGNRLIAEYEQRVILQKVLDKDPETAKYLGGYVEPPVQGYKMDRENRYCPKFKDHNSKGDFGKFGDRWDWVENCLWPHWKTLCTRDMANARNLAKGDPLNYRFP